ncbi:glycerol-3-phosphate 1-O-acyltransferase PlsY [Synergistaceae bacterium OttesenSCG-928-I11]|nr:glycerol-3-phosphate 1-O-acyltransferase PlsY [Synergistaceae bacterium OttesenSCG-928-I11]
MTFGIFFSAIFWVIFGYISGSCPTGYVLVRTLLGEDIRRFGSGNIGATNVSRVLGKKWGVFTAVFDMMKGGLAVLIAMAFGVENPAILSLIGCAAVIGHDYPIWLGFNGGKGVATTFGVFSCYDFFNPLSALIGGGVWFLVREKTRYVSLASILGLSASALVMPIFMSGRSYYFSAILLSLLAIWRHRENIKRLIAGTENKVEPLLPKIKKYFETKH